MICRDTRDPNRSHDEQQDQGAIDKAIQREEEMFDKLGLNQGARDRCGVKHVYQELFGLFHDYIRREWQPDVMTKLEALFVYVCECICIYT